LETAVAERIGRIASDASEELSGVTWLLEEATLEELAGTLEELAATLLEDFALLEDAGACSLSFGT
jgi:hypothetical protein